MILDAPTLSALAAELHERLAGSRLHAASAGPGALALSAGDGLGLRLCFGPPGRLEVIDALRVRATDGDERYLSGALVAEAVSAGPRWLTLRLSRADADGQPTYGGLHLALFPPRFRAVLASERHGRILGAWAGAGDRRAARRGEAFAAFTPGAGLDPTTIIDAQVLALLEAGDGDVAGVLRRGLAGADRHLLRAVCAVAGVAAAAAADCGPDAAARLATALRATWSPTPPAGRGLPAHRWDAGGGNVRVSVVAPPDAAPPAFASVCAALAAEVEEDGDAADRQRRAGRATQLGRLRNGHRRLQRREQALAADLEEAQGLEAIENTGASLLAAPGRVAPGGQGEVPDVTDGRPIAVHLEPQETQADRGAGLLRRAARLRRRRQEVPPRLHRVRELLRDTEALLARLEAPSADPLEEEEMERWQRKVAVRPAPADHDGGGGQRAGADDGRHGARPRRYRTSDGWSVWAGRNNRENDVLSHKLAAQNDVWFHAHGYAGSHVVLRRDGRKEEPSARTLEEAAGVAAYWSKGRTANKVPVVYTLAKYVSKPRGGPPGLAVMKREKTLMVRPQLLDEEEDRS